MKTDIVTTETSKKRLPTWVRWIPACVLLALLYFVSVGPVFRLYTHGKVSHNALIIYKPLISTHSPLFEITRDYLIEWVS
ncbi:MAG: hypothetical protein HY300_01895 [Verrucomicrobia bacterium]|nr:hypothetical protein [Verrucomicrobiota bacterium]